MARLTRTDTAIAVLIGTPIDAERRGAGVIAGVSGDDRREVVA